MKRCLSIKFLLFFVFMIFIAFFFVGCSDNTKYVVLVYHSNSESEFESVTKAEKEIDSYVLPQPEKADFTFVGWYLDSNLTTAYSVENLSPGVNELYAKYVETPFSYSVEVTSNLMQGLSLTGGAVTQTITNTASFTPIYITAKEGYRYLYYEVNNRKYFENTITLDEVRSNTTINVVCEYIIKEYTLVFHTNSEDEVNSITKTENEIDSYVLPQPEKADFTFVGWYLDSNLTTAYSVENLSPGVNELYAKYVETPFSYSVEVTSNLMQGLSLTGGTVTQTITNTTSFTPITIAAKEGYRYLYYEVNNRKYFENTITLDEVRSNTTINVVCEYIIKEYTLVFHTNSEDEVNSVTKNEYEIESYVLPQPEKADFTFVGWYLDSNLTTAYSVENLSPGVNELYAKYVETPFSYNVVVTSNLMQGLILTGGSATQTITNTASFTPITIAAKEGYRYLYYEVNNRKYFENTITLDEVRSNTTINVVCEYATYELPIINIDTNNAPIPNKYDYVPMTFSSSNCSGALNSVSGGIRLRGNSTSTYAKKPYRIKFDKKQSLFGLTKAKSWVLLADYLDPSALHNYTALSLGAELDGLQFTPTPNKVNLYLNGDYVGLYTLCEQVQENQGRINIEKDITAGMTNLFDFNFFVCMNESVRDEADAVLDETYFYLEDYDKYIELKYPEKADFTSDEQFQSFFTQLKAYVKSVFDAFDTQDSVFISGNCNINSLVDYLIVDEIMGEIDHQYKSFNMYYTSTSQNIDENNKLNFGPIWDYDWCLRTPWTGEPNVYYTVSNSFFYSNVFFQYVVADDDTFAILKERYAAFSDTFGDIIDDVLTYSNTISESLKLNSQKWYGEEQIMMDNIIFLNKFLLARKTLLDAAWIV